MASPVPRTASSRLDLAKARARAVAAATAAKSAQTAAAQTTPAKAPKMTAPRKPWNVTWLGDMLTPDRNSFAVMRFVLAFAVLISHAIYLTTGKGELEPLYRWTNYTLGQHGVQVFFFLSGILVAQSLFVSRDVRDYATARALRIFPALIVCVLLTALVVGPWLSSLPSMAYLRDQGVAAYIAKTVMLYSGSAQLPGTFSNNPVAGAVNTSVWTLKYEALCYVLLAIAGFFIMRMKRWRETAFAFAAIWLAVVLYKPAGLELHGGAKSSLEVLRYFTIFFGAGVMAYALRSYIPVHAALLVPLGAAFVYAIGTRFQEPAAAVFLGYLAIWLSTLKFGGLRDYTNSNDYSYATYLYHMPIAQVILHFAPSMHVLPLILMTTGFTLWLAFLSWELIERPALRMRHRIWKPSAKAVEKAAEATFDVALAAAKSKAAMGKAGDAVRAAAAKTAAAATAKVATAKATAAAPNIAATVIDATAASVQPAASAAASTVMEPVAAPADAAASQVAPGIAHVWRPMSAGRKVKILPDSDGDASTAPAPISVRASRLPTTNGAVANTGTRVSMKMSATDVSEPAPRTSGIPANRMAMATKRTPKPETKPLFDAAPEMEREASRAVVPVRDDDDAPRPHVSRPRPNWSRPIEAGKPQLV